MQRPHSDASRACHPLPQAEETAAFSCASSSADASSAGDFVDEALQKLGLAADTGRAPPLPARRTLVGLAFWQIARCGWRVYRLLFERQREFNILTLGSVDAVLRHSREREAVLRARLEVLEQRVQQLAADLEKRPAASSARSAA